MLFSLLLPFIIIRSGKHGFLCFPFSGWICEWICWRANWRRRVQIADQTCTWKQRNQFLYVNCNKGKYYVLSNINCLWLKLGANCWQKYHSTHWSVGRRIISVFLFQVEWVKRWNRGCALCACFNSVRRNSQTLFYKTNSAGKTYHF